MAIKPNKNQIKQSSSPEFNKPGSGDPPPFRATGKGWFNRYPDFAASVKNANASLTNRATSQSNDELYKIYLFVNTIETGWKVSGETGQGPTSRVFYPRNLTQDELVIQGLTASQYEYDKIVQFVEHHHYSQIKPQGLIAQSYDGNSYPSVDFSLFKPANSQTFDAYTPLRYSIVILNIEAGHERFLNYPTYNLTCKVVYDYLGSQYQIQQDITERINRKQVFGKASNPSPATSTSSSKKAG